jgi:pimeloyl-ACP methyl ester carboxylesterase
MPDPASVPRIRYATTSDGLSVAWQSTGSGPALVWMPSLGNLVAQWRIPFLRRAYEALAGSVQLVLYDGRGTGSSSRQVDAGDLGVDSQLRDLDVPGWEVHDSRLVGGCPPRAEWRRSVL